MKKILLSVLFASAGLMAADSGAPATKSSKIEKGAAIYMKKCALCHGEKAQKGPVKGIAPIAGMDTTILARKIREYRDQEERHGAYAKYKDNRVMEDSTLFLSNEQIDAIAIYVNSLK